jgi:hypothetical protein
VRKINFVLVALFIICAVPLGAMAAEMKSDPTTEAIFQKRLARIRKTSAFPVSETSTLAVEPEKVAAIKAAPPVPPVATSDSLRKIAKEATNAPASQTKWDSFHEVSAYGGGYKALDDGSKGFWGMAEWIRWQTKRTDSANYGLGVTMKGDYGWGKNDSHWGSLSVGPNLDYWTELTDNQYLLAKFRPLYRFNESSPGKSNGFMPGGYLEYSNAFAGNDTFIAALDGQYFKNDSYLGLNLLIEHRFNRVVKMKAGMGLTLQSLSSETLLGIGPNLSFRFYDRFVIGASANFMKGGPILGLYAGYELNTDLRELDAVIREKSVQQKVSGVTAEMPTGDEEIMLTKSGENFTTLHGANEIRSNP